MSSAAFFHAADVLLAITLLVGRFHVAVHEIIRGHTARCPRLTAGMHDGFGAGDLSASAKGGARDWARTGLDAAFFA
jgi:hypothetical protein